MSVFKRLFIVLALVVLPSLTVMAGPVDINTADAKALAKALTGIGDVKATAIVEYRQKNGPFKSVDDLTLVKGIGEKTVEANRDNMTVGPSAVPTE